MNKRAQSAAGHAAVTDSFALELNQLSHAIDAALLARAGGAVLASAAGLGLLVTPAPGQAATFSVNSTADAFDDNLGDGICATVAGECTLRAAIEEANTNNNGPGVVDQVTFDSALSGSIVLNGMEIPIADELTITGPGDGVLTVDAGDLSRIFNATSTTSLTTISGLTLTNGNSAYEGGAIYATNDVVLDNITLQNNHSDDGGGFYVANGDVTVANSSVSGNSALNFGGGFFVQGNVTLTNSNVSSNESGIGYTGVKRNVKLTDATVSGNTKGTTDGNGGGFYVLNGDVLLEDTTIQDNMAGKEGGGFYVNNGDATVTNSTISGNMASEDGGGFYVDQGNATLSNSTVSGNAVGGSPEGDEGGGFFVDYGDVTLTYSTVSGNTAEEQAGGFYVYGSAALENSIVAGNSAATDPGFYASGSLSASYNLVEGASDPSVNGGTNGNITGADPGLALLADNGGPTLTHAIDSSSPAFNAGDPNFTPPPDFDQRGSGFPRVAQTRLDMGAYEFQGIVATPTASLALSGSPFAENGGVATVTATLSTASGQDVNVEFAFAGAAALNTDFIASATQVTIPAGSTAAGIGLTGQNDLQVEGPESVVVSIDSITNAQVGTPASVTGEISDDDQAQAEPVVPIPALGPLGLLLLPLLIPIAGWRYLRKRWL